MHETNKSRIIFWDLEPYHSACVAAVHFMSIGLSPLSTSDTRTLESGSYGIRALGAVNEAPIIPEANVLVKHVVPWHEEIKRRKGKLRASDYPQIDCGIDWGKEAKW